MRDKPEEGGGMGKASVRVRFLIGRFMIIACVGFVILAVLIMALVRIDEKVYADGHIVARDDEDVRAHATGLLRDVRVYEGDKVKKGDLLAQLEDTAARNALERRREALAKARSALEVVRDDLDKLKIDTLPEKLRFTKIEVEQFELKMKEAAEEWRTAAGLMKKGIVSRREVNRLHTKYRIAKNELEQARRKHRIVESGLAKTILGKAVEREKAAREAVNHAEQERRRLEAEVARHRYLAPADGVVIEARLRGGDAVKPGDLLVKIQTSDRLELRVNVSGDQVSKVKPGQQALIYSVAYSYSKYGLAYGKVLSVSSSPERVGDKWLYLARIAVESCPMPLPIGSAAQARIVARRRTILQMLFDSD